MEQDKDFTQSGDEDFPWELGVFDAHCHPTDTMLSIDEISTMKTQTLAIMATRGEDQELVAQIASKFNGQGEGSREATSERIRPCFGWHPWFSHQILDDITRPTSTMSKEEHYKAVLTPAFNDQNLLRDLPEPRSLSSLISDIRSNLIKHPKALVGEIGLDRAFRIPNAWLPHELESRDPSLTPGSREGRSLSPYRVQPAHQKAIFKAQLRLAGEMRRPVSIHSVQAHGAVFEVLRELWAGHERKVISNKLRKRRPSAEDAHDQSEDELDKSTHKTRNHLPPLPFPPKICMHSYSGPPEPLRQFLHPSTPAEIYFSFSHVINFTGDSLVKVNEVIKMLPEDRILVESDLHCAGKQMDDLLEQAVRRICSVRGWSLRDGVRILGDNWRRFISEEE
ncbi:hypothetical protein VTO42DRAFT_6029 [Malbranchea cinnamomea]